METVMTNQPIGTPLNKTVVAGRVISALGVLFLLFDAIAKIIRESYAIQGSVALGWPEDLVQAIGVVLLLCTILYVIPRTALLGAVLLTGYLGGAIAIMVRAGQPLYFALIFGILIWCGLLLRDEKLRRFVLSGK